MQAEKEYKEKLRLLREDVDRSGGVYGGAELALLEQTGTCVRVRHSMIIVIITISITATVRIVIMIIIKTKILMTTMTILITTIIKIIPMITTFQTKRTKMALTL